VFVVASASVVVVADASPMVRVAGYLAIRVLNIIRFFSFYKNNRKHRYFLQDVWMGEE
jgi:hypothetical protein